MILPVNIRQSDVELVNLFREVCSREGGISKVVRDFMVDYVKKHGSGNPSFPIDKFIEDPGFQALPTLGEVWGKDRLDKLDVKDLELIESKGKLWALMAREAQQRKLDAWRNDKK